MASLCLSILSGVDRGGEALREDTGITQQEQQSWGLLTTSCNCWCRQSPLDSPALEPQQVRTAALVLVADIKLPRAQEGGPFPTPSGMLKSLLQYNQIYFCVLKSSKDNNG